MERIANYGGCIVGKSQFFLAEISATAVVPINEISGRMIGNTAKPALTGFAASKYLWVRNNAPENNARCKQI